MACLGFNPVGPVNCMYSLQTPSHSQVSSSSWSQIQIRGNFMHGFPKWRCQVESETMNEGWIPNKTINKRIALASVAVAVGLFAATRGGVGGVSLGDLSANATSYEEALTNGMPTVVEFYADWCEVCRELAPDVYKVEQEYKDRVNFVMLNVDNSKWEEELDEFGVEGIPHFAFLDKEGNEEGNVVGRIPRKYLFDNVASLARGDKTIPHSRVVGKFSNAGSRKVNSVDDPRSHGKT